MAVQGDEIAARIEAQIREAIQRVVGDVRSSIQDVKEAVDSQLNAALQSVQADANALSLRGEIDPLIQELMSSAAPAGPAAPAAPPPAPVAAGPDGAMLRQAVRSVEQGKSQVEILNALLDQTLRFGSRAALLILKGDSFTGWKGKGFGRHGGDDEQIKRLTIPPGAVAELDQLRTAERSVHWNGNSLATRAAASAPAAAVIIPMVIKDKVAAAVYVDRMDGEQVSFDQASLELLVFTTGLLIDTLAIRKKIPSPTLSGEPSEPVEEIDPFGAVTVEPPRAPAPPPPPVRPTPPPPPPPPPEAAPPDTPAPSAPSQGFELDEYSGDSTVAITPEMLKQVRAATPPPPAPDFPPAPPPTPAAPPEPPAPPKPPSVEAPADRPTTQYVPPSSAGRAGGGPASPEQKKHDEARRFARLLVSEIKLYNEAKVDQGRKNRDLYERLKEDIDRSRQMYEDRVPDEVRKASNYFYDELVRILADGDSEALGL